MNSKCTLILLFTLLVSCQKNGEEAPNKTIKVSISTEKKEISEVFSEFEFIHLKYDELIPSIFRVKEYKEDLFLLDGRKDRIFKLGKNGALDIFLQASGEGPEEYKSIGNFEFNRNSGELMVFDNVQRTLHNFTNEGQFSNSFLIKPGFAASYGNFFHGPKNEIILDIVGGKNHRFLKVFVDKNEYELFQPLDSAYHDHNYGNDRQVAQNKDGFSSIYSVESTIFQNTYDFIKTDSIDLDFGEFEILKSDLKNLGNNPNLFFELIQNDENKKAHSFGLLETENFYHVSFYLGSLMRGDFLNTLIHKDSKNSKTFKGIKIRGVELESIIIGQISDDRFILSLNIEYINNLTEEQKASISEYIPTDYLDDNPILLIGKVKAF
ncbi:6-bladed beta-propeller [Aquiflexum gelatinilyticum]|uniref:6-bladed beta-propeller n=1 Tax=Aquiflexum gelatinilyticum TaxID=2961943 RepID=A0A9X2PAD4_9BACT|nr:6-bladed beta-propeller [Aquiflexum gelatinilyticum]MCR9015025.1 6-bladed beta-propeller [Aquiflexum gelatinilyticum]